MRDKYADNREMERVIKEQKKEHEEEERARAREREADLVKDMEKKEVRLITIQLPAQPASRLRLSVASQFPSGM